jgi:Putative metallopeptidase
MFNAVTMPSTISGITKAAMLAAAIGLATSMPAAAQPLTDPGTSAVRIAYVDPVNPAHRPILERLKQRRVLEDLQTFLSPLKLPAPLTIKVEGCNGTVNAWYAANTVTYCYELIDYIRSSAPKQPTSEGVTPEDAVLGAFVDILLHEVSHGIFDILKIPVFGREEDAADHLAAFILLQFGQTVARRTLSGTALFWGGIAATQKLQMRDFADVHGIAAQRFYNVLCIAYGKERNWFNDFVQKGMLPRERAETCEAEYRQVGRAYLDLIAPHVDPELQRQVMARQWLRADDGK